MKLHNTEALQRRDDAQASLATDGAALDVRELPSFGFGHRSLMWWGTLGLIAIESTVFALTLASYFYLRSHADHWPLDGTAPRWLWGSTITAVLLVSLWPAHRAKRAAERLDLPAVRLWMAASLAFAIAVLVLRGFEFTGLATRWDSNAYGSVVWLLMGLHTFHLVTDAWDTGVLTVLAFTGPLEGRRYVDVSENALYWYFVVWSWLPLYAVVYGAPRWLQV